eukprot:772769_1
MAKNPTIIKRLMTQECKILNKLIYFHENKYHIGSLSYLSLKWCHIKDSKSKRDMRIIWNNIFIIDSVNNTGKIKAIMEPGSSIEGYLAMNSTHRDYQRVFSVDKASKSNDINRVKFRDDKEWIELDEFINIKTDTFPTLVPMMRAINTKIYKKIIRQKNTIKWCKWWSIRTTMKPMKLSKYAAKQMKKQIRKQTMKESMMKQSMIKVNHNKSKTSVSTVSAPRPKRKLSAIDPISFTDSTRRERWVCLNISNQKTSPTRPI